MDCWLKPSLLSCSSRTAQGLCYANDHMHLPRGSTINSFPKNIPGVEKHLGKHVNLNLPTTQEVLPAPVLTAYRMTRVLDFCQKGQLHSSEPDIGAALERPQWLLQVQWDLRKLQVFCKLLLEQQSLWGRAGILLCSTGWPGPHDPPASSS